MTMRGIEEAWTSIKHHFGGHVVHRSRDEWGDILVVDNRHLRVLSFGSAYEQSCIDQRTPQTPVHEYARAMLLGLAFAQPRHITLLGLGGGALVRSMQHALPDCFIQAVELRSEVAQVAQDYFGLTPGPLLDIQIDDARQYLRSAEPASTDLLFSDLFFSSDMNPFQRQKKFIQHCHRMLTDDGWLVINYHRLPDVEDPFYAWMLQWFPSLYTCGTGSGNQVVLAGKGPRPDMADIKQETSKLEMKLGARLLPLFQKLEAVGN
ncbi:MAG TPA: hypothetical protein VM553_15640 [Dongiaceae bacterium]|nr:hypothetical protein [Dongiaceae bacterium]